MESVWLKYVDKGSICVAKTMASCKEMHVEVIIT